jgi:hypothetical protein
MLVMSIVNVPPVMTLSEISTFPDVSLTVPLWPYTPTTSPFHSTVEAAASTVYEVAAATSVSSALFEHEAATNAIAAAVNSDLFMVFGFIICGCKYTWLNT